MKSKDIYIDCWLPPHKRNVRQELWEDYKSLNISNGYTPIEIELDEDELFYDEEED